MSHALDPAQFWRSTPRELALVFAGTERRMAREHNERMTQAWFTAALMRAGGRRLPPLQKFLVKEPGAPERKTDAKTIEASFRALTLAMGGKIVNKSELN